MCWCVDVLMCWLCWCIMLLCWCVDDCVVHILLCWCVHVFMCLCSCVDVFRCVCVDVLMRWCVDCPWLPLTTVIGKKNRLAVFEPFVRQPTNSEIIWKSQEMIKMMSGFQKKKYFVITSRVPEIFAFSIWYFEKRNAYFLWYAFQFFWYAFPPLLFTSMLQTLEFELRAHCPV